ncbi:hypothetical protein BaRGS_00000393 [Batillaria attramentaria]|uniref:Uncharacterized protein n=1 Tax=Batillaria attramentaria TaxID=370345 RepID=A0ABD0M8L3_9CAEN
MVMEKDDFEPFLVTGWETAETLVFTHKDVFIVRASTVGPQVPQLLTSQELSKIVFKRLDQLCRIYYKPEDGGSKKEKR